MRGQAFVCVCERERERESEVISFDIKKLLCDAKGNKILHLTTEEVVMYCITLTKYEFVIIFVIVVVVVGVIRPKRTPSLIIFVASWQN